jgi:Flp pilus assembly protein TadG
MNQVVKKLHRLSQSFRTAQGGNVVMTFALALIPLVGFVGAAVDYSRGNAAKATLQTSLDSAVLATAGATLQSPEDRIAVGKKQFSANFSLPNPPAPSITIKEKTIEGTAQYVVPTMFLGVVGVQQMDITATAQALVEVTPICLLLLEKSQNALYGNSDSTLTAKIVPFA